MRQRRWRRSVSWARGPRGRRAHVQHGGILAHGGCAGGERWRWRHQAGGCRQGGGSEGASVSLDASYEHAD